MLLELMSRESDGIRVDLSYDDSSADDPRIPPLVIAVNAKGLPCFTAAAETTAEALEIFQHPYGCLNWLLKTGKVAA